MACSNSLINNCILVLHKHGHAIPFWQLLVPAVLKQRRNTSSKNSATHRCRPGHRISSRKNFMITYMCLNFFPGITLGNWREIQKYLQTHNKSVAFGDNLFPRNIFPKSETVQTDHITQINFSTQC